MLRTMTGLLTLAISLTHAGSFPSTAVLSAEFTAATPFNVVTVDTNNMSSLYLDGAGDRARITDAAPVNPSAVPAGYQVSGTAITVEAWVYPMDVPAPGQLREIITRPPNNGYGLDPYRTFGLSIIGADQLSSEPVLAFIISDGVSTIGTAGEIAVRDTARVKVGEWTHVAGTYDGSSVKLYINGALVSSLPFTASIGTGTTGLYIGGHAFGAFKGLIDEVRLWNVTRSVSEIQTAKDVTLQGNETGLAGYWPMDSTYYDFSAQLLVTADLSPNRNDLVMQFDAKLVGFPQGSIVQLAPTNITGYPDAVTGAEYRRAMTSDGWPKPSLTLNQGPGSMTQTGDTLIWTPTSAQFGPYYIIAQATNAAGSLVDTFTVYSEGMRASENLTRVDIANRGKAGMRSRYGKGLYYNGKNGMYQADFSLVDRNSLRYAGGLYSSFNSFRPVEGFTDVPSRFPGFTAFRTSFTDEWESNRIGVRVFQTAHVKQTSPDERYTIVEYRVVNESGSAIDDLFAQMTADLEVGTFNNNLGGYDSSLALTYGYENGGANNSHYYGFQVLSHPASGRAVWNAGSGADAQFVRSTANLTTFPAVPATAGDTRNQISAGPFTLAANETLTVAFAWLAADDLAQLQAAAQAARTVYTSTAPTYLRALDLAVPGAEYRSRVVRNGSPLASVSAVELPAGMVLNGDTLVWTPSDGDIGFRRVILDASNPAGTLRDTLDIFVEAVRSAENQVRLDLTNRGKVGVFGLYDKGMQYKGNNGLYAADLSFVDRNHVKYAGGLFSTFNSFRPDGPLTSPVGFSDTTSRFPGFTAFTTSFSDQWEPFNGRIRLNIRMTAHWKDTAPDDRFVIVEYAVTNAAGSEIDELFAQMTADFDVGNSVANLGGHDSLHSLTYVFEQGGITDSSYYGLQLLSHPVAGRALFESAAGPQYVRSYANLTTLYDGPTNPADLRAQLGAGPFVLGTADTIRFAVAFHAGDDLDQLRASAQQASTVYTGSTTSVAGPLAGIPGEFSLEQNYPNPFNPSTSIRFALPTASSVRLEVFNVLGQKVAVLHDGQLTAGYHTMHWTATVASGLYFYRLEAVPVSGTGDRFVSVKRMIFMK